VRQPEPRLRPRAACPRGARTRGGCPCRSPAIHGKLRCPTGQARGKPPHGGHSPGPRAPESLPLRRPAAASGCATPAPSIHGNCCANPCALNRFRLTLLRVSRVDIALDRDQAHLPPVFAGRLCGHPPELMLPPRPIGGITVAEDRAMRHAVVASLAPWHAAHTNASSSRRAASAETRTAA